MSFCQGLYKTGRFNVEVQHLLIQKILGRFAKKLAMTSKNLQFLVVDVCFVHVFARLKRSNLEFMDSE